MLPPPAHRALLPLLLALAAGIAPVARVHAQDAAPPRADAAPPSRVQLGAQAIGVVTRADPAYRGRAFTEGYLTQPIVHAHARLPALPLAVQGALDFEGLTLERGELNAGVYGEGYVDRRHPHTLLHELVLGVEGDVRGAALSLFAGKGFVPFGTDDPMSRPFVKFPVNHHLAQILERLVAVGAARGGPLLVEGALFNGDEPTSPWAWPRARRFGDSWALRAAVLPLSGVELAGSTAAVTSPEHADGDGLDQRKWSVALRVERPGPRAAYLLAEWARTDERRRERRAFRYESLLAEAAGAVGPLALAARLERTDRPEEERLADPFRTPRPHGDFNLLGVTRWQVATVHVALPIAGPAGTRLRPFVEVAHAHAEPRVRGAVFVPAAFYGSARQWSLSAGLRASVGAEHGRMGRYGAARTGGAASHAHAGAPAHHFTGAPAAGDAPVGAPAARDEPSTIPPGQPEGP